MFNNLQARQSGVKLKLLIRTMYRSLLNLPHVRKSCVHAWTNPSRRKEKNVNKLHFPTHNSITCLPATTQRSLCMRYAASSPVKFWKVIIWLRAFLSQSVHCLQYLFRVNHHHWTIIIDGGGIVYKHSLHFSPERARSGELSMVITRAIRALLLLITLTLSCRLVLAQEDWVENILGCTICVNQYQKPIHHLIRW